jgi:hypothetical protein
MHCRCTRPQLPFRPIPPAFAPADQREVVKKPLIVLIKIAFVREDQHEPRPRNETILVRLVRGKFHIGEDQSSSKGHSLRRAIESARVIEGGRRYY